MKINTCLPGLFTLIGALCLVIASPSQAKGLMSLSDREYTWELSLQTKYADSTSIDFDGGASADLNSSWDWGFGFGYNFTENWAFNFDINWGSTNYEGIRVLDDGQNTKESISGTLSSSSSDFRAVYHFMDKRFTPFVGASLGWIYIDTNIPTGPPQTSCWYDPWMGYICSTYQPTKAGTEFSYTANVGVRFDLTDAFFLRASAGKRWIDFDNASGTPDITMYRFDMGFMFR